MWQALANIIRTSLPQFLVVIGTVLCSLLSLQHYTKALSAFQRSSLVEKSRQKLQEGITALSIAFKMNYYDAEPLLQSCGVSIYRIFTTVKGRTLPAPTKYLKRVHSLGVHCLLLGWKKCLKTSSLGAPGFLLCLLPEWKNCNINGKWGGVPFLIPVSCDWLSDLFFCLTCRRCSVTYPMQSKEECDLINLAKPHMHKSTVLDSATGKSTDSRVRTSSGIFLARGCDKTIRDIDKRIADFTFIPVGFAGTLHLASV